MLQDNDKAADNLAKNGADDPVLPDTPASTPDGFSMILIIQFFSEHKTHHRIFNTGVNTCDFGLLLLT